MYVCGISRFSWYTYSMYVDAYGVHLVSSSSMLYKEMYISMQYVGTYVCKYT